MRRLLQFLKKFRDFLLFLFLQVIALTLFFNSKNYHKAQMVNTSSGVVGWFVEKKHNITKHFSLSAANDSLAKENASLRELIPQSYYQLQDRVFYVNDTLFEQQYEYIPAQVINSSNNKRDNYFTLNKGRLSGVQKGMGVISKDGIIGFVIDVSEHYSVVKTLLSENINISARLRKNNEHWLLKWNGKNSEQIQLTGVTHDIDIEEGDIVVSRGDNGIFPENEMVGKVSKIETEDGKSTLNVDVKLSVNFGSVYHVYVVKNFFKEEQKEIEESYYLEDE